MQSGVWVKSLCSGEVPVRTLKLGAGLCMTPDPPLVSPQEVHDLLSDYELKYCFVDKYKGTGWLGRGRLGFRSCPLLGPT